MSTARRNRNLPTSPYSRRFVIPVADSTPTHSPRPSVVVISHLAGGHLQNLWHTRAPGRAVVSPCPVSATRNSPSRSQCSNCRHERYVEADRADDIGSRRIGATGVAIRRSEFTVRFRPVRPAPSAWHEMPGSFSPSPVAVSGQLSASPCRIPAGASADPCRE